MGSDDSAAGEQHLVCGGCESNPTVAMVDGNEVLVCHCTGADNDLDPYPIHGFDILPDPWAFVEHGEVVG